MKKAIICSFVLLFSTFITLRSNAQAPNDNSFILSLSPQLCIPKGGFQTTHKKGWGGNIEMRYALSDRLRAVGAYGAMSYDGRQDPADPAQGDYSAVITSTYRAGLEYFVVGGLFVSGQAGVLKEIQAGVKSHGLTYCPAMGFEFGSGIYFSVVVKYEMSKVLNGQGQKINTLGLSVVYHI